MRAAGTAEPCIEHLLIRTGPAATDYARSFFSYRMSPVKSVLWLTVALLICLSGPGPCIGQGPVSPGQAARIPDTPTAEQLALVADKDLEEVSGLAASGLFPDCCWMHNDSGDSARLFLVRFDGSTRAVVRVRDTRPYDWEDLCSFTQDGASWLLIGDIGDNARRRGSSGPNALPPCRLLLLKEQPLPEAKKDQPARAEWTAHAEIEFSFEDGPLDCESLAVDVENQVILLLSKSQPLTCGLYQLPLSLTSGRRTQVAKRISSVGVPFATAMDMAPSGRQLAIVTMLNGMLVTRLDGETWSQACQRPQQVLNLPPRKQGESVCFSANGDSLLLNSEGVNQPLWKLSLGVPPHPVRPSAASP